VVVKGADLHEIEALYRSGFERFATVACAITGSQAAARDAVQDAFASAVRRRDRFRGDGSLEAWLWRAVVNEARSQQRRRRSRERLEQRAARLDGGRDLAADGTVAGIDGYVAALPERQRLVVFLRYYADLTHDQIAAALGVRPGTVAATLNAAHAKLRPLLAEGTT
jgi:RNA polymerase sigma-70 factor (ECF subfamily)